jgi:hypothetical protein
MTCWCLLAESIVLEISGNKPEDLLYAHIVLCC